MHSTVVDIVRLLEHSNISPDILSLTETKHTHINSLWRNILHDFKILHYPPQVNPDTRKPSGGTALAVKKSSFRTTCAIDVPKDLRSHLVAAIITPHAGTPIIAISVYMPQLRESRQKLDLYWTILKWIIITCNDTHKDKVPYVGGDFQATSSTVSHSFHPILKALTISGFFPLNDPNTPTFQPADTPIDHWLSSKAET